MSNPRALPLWLAAAVFAAQLVLAWHAPSHIDTGQSTPHQELLASADCQVCTHGQGLLALPSSMLTLTPSAPFLGVSSPLWFQISRATPAPQARGPPTLS